MSVIIGIDPGSRKTGYGVIKSAGPQVSYVGSGVIYTGTGDLASRLLTIYTGLSELIGQFSPEMMAVEQAFLAKNVQSTVKLAEARSAAIVAGANLGLNVFEYTPMQIKQAVVGYGAAQKQQVQYMVRHILHLNGDPPEDAADALACAICHGYTYRVTTAMGDQVAQLSSVHGRLRQ
ncbi:MAG: crossover junction endodeoxyribonuclease RuvC [Succinivibrio sp.]|nr:crossover junction endodeoxyribonuclease RuvC [Succinivibrio sp.]